MWTGYGYGLSHWVLKDQTGPDFQALIAEQNCGNRKKKDKKVVRKMGNKHGRLWFMTVIRHTECMVKKKI
jgi:hypothetical protein